MSWAEYNAASHEWPYTLNLESSRGALLYFGVQHSSSPRDQQLVTLEKFWEGFRPTIAFNEGGDPPVAQSRDEAITQYGEAGLVRWLASRDGVPISSLDLSRDLQANALRPHWPSEQVKLFFLVRALLPCESRSSCDPKAELGRILPIISSTTGIGSPPNTVEEVEQTLANIPPAEGGSTDHAKWFDPTQAGHPFNVMAREVEDARDRHMVSVITLALQKGHRVFAVAGGSHVSRQEPALRSMYKPRAKSGQPHHQT
jgi:hypothetical protein